MFFSLEYVKDPYSSYLIVVALFKYFIIAECCLWFAYQLAIFNFTTENLSSHFVAKFLGLEPFWGSQDEVWNSRAIS